MVLSSSLVAARPVALVLAAIAVGGITSLTVFAPPPPAASHPAASAPLLQRAQVPDAVVPDAAVPDAVVPDGTVGLDQVRYQPPVVGPVSDAFRPPTSFAGAGNRGLEYDTSPGQEVSAAAPGTVVFAGAIGGENFVTILHDDGLRSSYSFLDRVVVASGQRVGSDDIVGASGHRFHFGVRVGDTYLDPAILFAASLAERSPARLIPVNS